MKRSKPNSSLSVCAAVSNIREQEDLVLSVPESRKILKDHVKDTENASTKAAAEVMRPTKIAQNLLLKMQLVLG